MEMLMKIAETLRTMSNKFRQEAKEETDIAEGYYKIGKADGLDAAAEQVEILIGVNK